MLGLKPERFHLLLETMSQPVALCGKQFIADNSGALYWPGEATLLVADLHLEKGSAYAERGSLLPPYDTRQTLMRLAEVIDRYEPARVIALGDSVHDVGAARRMAAKTCRSCACMQEDREWIWLTGNHDPKIAPSLGGRALGEFVHRRHRAAPPARPQAASPTKLPAICTRPRASPCTATRSAAPASSATVGAW